MKILSASLLLASLALSPTVHADVREVAGKMGVMWNATSAGSAGVSGNTGVALGGFSFRTPQNQSFQVIAYDAPRLQAGCGGIDLYFGSFSMISGDNIQQLMRAIVSNAVGYAFKVALDAICPSCQSILSDLQATVNELSNANVNTCQVASMAVDAAFNVGQGREQAIKDAQTYKDQLTSAAKGTRDSFTSAFSSVNAGGASAIRSRDGFNESTGYGNTLINVLITRKVLSSDMKEWGYVFSTPHDYAAAYMNFFGTTVTLTSPQKTDSKREEADKTFQAIWKFSDFVEGKKAGAAFQSYSCSDFRVENAGTCQRVHLKDSNWKGVKRHLIELLAGRQDGESLKISAIKDQSIMAVLKNNPNSGAATSSISDQQAAFFEQNISAPMRNTLSLAAQCGDSVAIGTAQQAAEIAADQLAGNMVIGMVDSVRRAYAVSESGGKEITPLSDSQIKAMDELYKDAVASMDNDKIIQRWDNLNNLVEKQCRTIKQK